MTIANFLCKKIVNEESRFWLVMVLPIYLPREIRARRAARKLGLPYLEFLKQESAQLQAEIRVKKENMQALKAQGMKSLADVIPGATVHDFNALESLPWLSIGFLKRELRNLLFRK